MSTFNRELHWNNIYDTKSLKEVSWYQPTPQTSLDLISKAELKKDAAIIDIGGGDSFLADHLLELGYTNITVLDISKNAIERAKKRLGENASKVQWIVSDVVDFKPSTTYDLWHDRAAFHFLTETMQIEHYLKTASKAIATNGVFLLGTFSDQGPTKCSGIDITQYTQQSMQELLSEYFTSVEQFNIDHPTPFNTIQNFTFGSFKKKV